jgi:nicotinate-nucleotide adenylyltransferase
MTTLPIGIFGGTFDPIHLGHIHLAKTIYRLCGLQKIILIPCHQSPFKVISKASAKDRFNMTWLAIKNLRFLEVDNYEIAHPSVSYTIQTLEHLHQKNRTTPLALIIGIDSFNRFDEWHQWPKILDFAHLLITNRKKTEKVTNKVAMNLLAKRQTFDHKELQKKMSGLIYLADINPLSISATEIRNLIKTQKDASQLVTPEVWQYINNHKLYIN